MTVPFSEEDWLPIAFVSGLLAISERALRSWYAEGRLEGRRQFRDPVRTGSLKLGRPVLHFRLRDVRLLLEDHRRPRKAPTG